MNIAGGIDGGIAVGWIGLDADPATFPAFPPDGIATFALGLEQGYTLMWHWPTDIQSSASDAEQRRPRNSRPQEAIAGSALLFDADAAIVRDELAKHIAEGSTFLIGLPHEALSLAADAIGATIPVATTDLSDWITQGQRVIVVNNGQGVEAIVQDKTLTTVVLDRSPGPTIGKRGAQIMPLMPVYLEPQQDFERYRTKAERWQIKARAATSGFALAAARVNLSLLYSPAFANAIAYARVYGLPGNNYVLETDGNAGFPAAGQLVETGPLTLFKFKPGVTTLGNLRDALLTSSNFVLGGTYNPADTFGALDELFMPATGGAGAGSVGFGASLTEYDGNPVWDRRLINSGTNTDTIFAGTEIVDHGGRIYAVGMQSKPKWGRAIVHKARGLAEWQWLKLFLVTVRGPAKVFWLSTWREDLAVISAAGASITVRGDVAAWYPKLRQHVHVRKADGTDVYAQITGATDNGDGTWTLTLNPFPGVTIPVTIPAGLFADAISVSWLELVRFAEETFTVTFTAGATFSLSTRAIGADQ